MNPRPYQTEAANATIRGFREFDKQLLVAATGAGKTFMASMLAKLAGGKTLFLAHREELIQQAAKEFTVRTGKRVGIEKAEQKAAIGDDIVVASVPTMQRKRLESWPKDHFTLIVADEAHHALADSWQNTLGQFDGAAKVLGITATPERGDHRELGSYFENISYQIGLKRLIGDGYLSPVSWMTLGVDFDLSDVKQLAGDYDAADLDRAIQPGLQGVVDAIKEEAGQRRILAFLPLIATSKAFVGACNAAGIKAEHVDGTSDDRAGVKARLQSGETQLVSNAMLWTEGFDCPEVDCIVPLRPTRSRPLYAQMIGRGTRLSPHTGKEDLLVMDFLWQGDKFNVCRPSSLVCEDEDLEQVLDGIPVAGEAVDLITSLSEAEEQLEQFLENKLHLKRRGSKLLHPQLFALLIDRPDLARWAPTMKWHSKELTTNQNSYLSKMGFDVDEVGYRGLASRLIDCCMERFAENLATPKQLFWLDKLDHPSPGTATFEQASAYLDNEFSKSKISV